MNSIKHQLIALFVIVASFTASVDAQKTPGGTPADAVPANRDESVLLMLQRTIVDAEYQRVDLEKIIQDLRDRYKLNIHVSWTALEAAGVRRDQRIEVALKQVSLTTLLDIILREASAADPGKLSYYVENGVVMISTGERSREQTVLRMYDIADLLDSGYSIRRFANTPVLGMELTGREFVGGEELQADKKPQSGFGGAGGGGGGGIYGQPGEEPARLSLSAMERVKQIIDLITETIDPEGWNVAGGDVGSIRVYGSTMLIQQTIRNHQRLGEFLEMLRSTRPQPLDADAAVIRMRADKAVEMRKQIGPNFPRLSAEQAEKLAMLPAGDGVLFRGTTSGFNGQGMLFSALTQRDVLSGAQAVVGDQSNAFAPISQTSTAGLELIVLPLVAPKAEDLTLDVQMAWVPGTQVAERKVTLAANQAEGSIDQTQRSMRTVSCTTKLKLGDAIALSIPAQLSDQGAAGDWEDWLIVRVHKPGT